MLNGVAWKRATNHVLYPPCPWVSYTNTGYVAPRTRINITYITTPPPKKGPPPPPNKADKSVTRCPFRRQPRLAHTLQKEHGQGLRVTLQLRNAWDPQGVLQAEGQLAASVSVAAEASAPCTRPQALLLFLRPLVGFEGKPQGNPGHVEASDSRKRKNSH